MYEQWAVIQGWINSVIEYYFFRFRWPNLPFATFIQHTYTGLATQSGRTFRIDLVTSTTHCGYNWNRIAVSVFIDFATASHVSPSPFLHVGQHPSFSFKSKYSPGPQSACVTNDRHLFGFLHTSDKDDANGTPDSWQLPHGIRYKFHQK